jgi:GNAT superfamily N-acetyltransferase
MEIIRAGENDLPEMIGLLKTSLGEGLIPKSIAYFTWKHEKNPFGKSKILLAKENGKIIGLRAFMKWQWESASSLISAVRAVDTATDPAFQGKGVFKKLTLQALEECRQENENFVFNTPNSISIQGYLKMGWFSIGRMPLLIGPGSVIPRIYKDSFATEIYSHFDAEKALNVLAENWKLPPAEVLFHTPLSKSYLRWRYQECPILKYGAVIEPGKFGIIFRLKKINKFYEFRICEIWTEEDKMASAATKTLKEIIRMVRPVMVSCAPSPSFAGGKKILPSLFGPIKRGPLTTLRPLVNEKLNNFEQFYHWRPSIGTMELF